MTPTQRANIGRGVKYAAMRKRQSEAMKASWAARRANGAKPLEQVDPDPFKCPKCPRAFHTIQGLRTHQARKHGKGWSTTGNLRKTKRKTVAAAPPVTFCPVCGCNIKNVALAVNFGNTP